MRRGGSPPSQRNEAPTETAEMPIATEGDEREVLGATPHLDQAIPGKVGLEGRGTCRQDPSPRTVVMSTDQRRRSSMPDPGILGIVSLVDMNEQDKKKPTLPEVTLAARQTGTYFAFGTLPGFPRSFLVSTGTRTARRSSTATVMI